MLIPIELPLLTSVINALAALNLECVAAKSLSYSYPLPLSPPLAIQTKQAVKFMH